MGTGGYDCCSVTLQVAQSLHQLLTLETIPFDTNKRKNSLASWGKASTSGRKPRGFAASHYKSQSGAVSLSSESLLECGRTGAAPSGRHTYSPRGGSRQFPGLTSQTPWPGIKLGELIMDAVNPEPALRQANQLAGVAERKA
jgi:hypothetical protein